MKSRITTVLALSLLSTACVGTVQYASISEAHKSYERGRYEKTLKLIAQAEHARALSPEQTASLTLLKARSHEQLGQLDRAAVLYRYLKEQHPDSQAAYLAQEE